MLRVLGIAPYEGLRELMETVAELREDIRLTAYAGNFHEGLAIAQSIDPSEYDVVVSRGGTTDLLREKLSAPVFSVELSYFDILNAIKLAQGYGGRFAIAGFPRTVTAAAMLCDILQYNDIPILVNNGEEDMESTLATLRQLDISMVVGDFMITDYARAHGLHAILITSDSKDVANAFDEAVRYFSYFQDMRRDVDYYHEALVLVRRRIVVLDRGGRVLFSDAPASARNACTTAAKRLLPAVIRSGRQNVLRRYGGHSFSVSADVSRRDREECYVFDITELDQGAPARISGIRLKNSDEISGDFVRMFYGGAAQADIVRRLENCRRARAVIIAGEPGTGKDSLAEYIYATGEYAQSVLCTVDCESLTADMFRNLLDSGDSPLYDRGYVFFFRRAELLDPAQRRQLIQLYREGALPVRNQMIFSVQESRHGTEREAACVEELFSEIPSVMLRVQPLRRRIHEIPSLVTLYLNEEGIKGLRRAAGIEPEGMSYLQSFLWPGNIRQLCRVLDVLLQVTNTAYIRADAVQMALRDEAWQPRTEDAPDPGMDLDRPLNQIIADVVRAKLSQEGMTQARAADELGICRTTLWKYLKMETKKSR